MSVINQDDLARLFSYFARYPDSYSRGEDEELLAIQSKCNEILAKDYNISIISNRQGELCATYPLDIVILESQKDEGAPSGHIKHVKRTKIYSTLGSSDDGEYANGDHHGHESDDVGIGIVPHNHVEEDGKSLNKNNGTKLEPLFQMCRFARVRTRFPVPVILWKNKNICRSSTLSQKLEYMLQAAANTLVRNDVPPDMMTRAHMESLRNRDITTIKELGVKYILDLMMENKKKKFGFIVCSSEKVDMHERYSAFTIASIPYPGVEFFQEFNQRKHVAHDLHFDWDKSEDVVELKLDPGPPEHVQEIAWKDYKNWDLVMLTQNYLRLMLSHMADPAEDAGLLVHCISGWDRTPLFISLLRITLWADRQIHQSLRVEELLYLTVAYDWLLFSHQLYDRASRGEDIFYFCFYFLQFIHSSEYGIPDTKSSSSQAPKSPAKPAPSPAPSQTPTRNGDTSNPLSNFSPHPDKEGTGREQKNSNTKNIAADRFSSLSMKLNSSSNSLPNLVSSSRTTDIALAPPTAHHSSSFTPTQNIPIAPRVASGGDAINPSPACGTIATSFSMISSTPHSGSSSSGNSSGNGSFLSSKSSIPAHSFSKSSYHGPTQPMEIHRSHSRHNSKASDCSPTDCTCGSWQMVSGFSLSDKYGSSIPHSHSPCSHTHTHSHAHSHTHAHSHAHSHSHSHAHTNNVLLQPNHDTNEDPSKERDYVSDDDSTDSSYFETVDADFTGLSWDEGGFFPHEQDENGNMRTLHTPTTPRREFSNGQINFPNNYTPPNNAFNNHSTGSNNYNNSHGNGIPHTNNVTSNGMHASNSPQLNGKNDHKSNGTTPPQPPPEMSPRSARLTELQVMGMRLYDQCCRAQAGNWTFFSRFLPRFG